MDRVREFLSRYRRAFLAAGALILLVWVSFLDSHSLIKRLSWRAEAAQLREENQALREEIDRLKAELESDLTDEQVERIAREQYGMQREGETVHPVESSE